MRPDQQKAFEEYGHLMANIGAFEAFMRVALAQRESPSTDEARAKRSARLTEMDFGQLLQEVYQKFKLPKDFLARIKQTKKVRDNLAHIFWVSHLGRLRSERGTNIILRQLRLFGLEVTRAVDVLLHATGVNTQSYIEFLDGRNEDPSCYVEFEAMLEQAERWESHVVDET